MAFLMFAHTLAFFWFVTSLVCFDWSRVLLSAYWQTNVRRAASWRNCFLGSSWVRRNLTLYWLLLRGESAVVPLWRIIWFCLMGTGASLKLLLCFSLITSTCVQWRSTVLKCDTEWVWSVALLSIKKPQWTSILYTISSFVTLINLPPLQN